MATVLDALKGINAYPIPLRTIIASAEGRGLPLNDDATAETLRSKEFNLAKADLLLWLAFAPNIAQGGQTYSFSDEQRTRLKNRADELYGEFAPDEAETPKPAYGYKGSRL